MSGKIIILELFVYIFILICLPFCLIVMSGMAVASITLSHVNPYFKVEPANITMGPESSINRVFIVVVKLYNVTLENAPNGIRRVDVNFTWNKTLIEPLSFVNKIGASDGVLLSPVLYGINPGFYDDLGKRITSPPYTNATSYKLSQRQGMQIGGATE